MNQNPLTPTVTNWDEQRRSFDRVAEAYDTFRPGYPRELIAAIVAAAALRAESRLLEIGSGTGKATAEFASLGCSILGVEPGPELAAVAARRLAAFPRVTFQQARFEDCTLPPEPFDLVFSAQAFHWITPEVGLTKAAEALKPGGWLALFWNRYPGMVGALAHEIQEAYDGLGVASMVTPDYAQKMERDIRERQEHLERSGLFSGLQVLRFAWSVQYTAQQYLGLLGTYSDHITLTATQRAALFAGVAAAIERHGGLIDRPYVAVLHLAQR